jgi:hypothetical protein
MCIWHRVMFHPFPLTQNTLRTSFHPYQRIYMAGMMRSIPFRLAPLLAVVSVRVSLRL